MTQKNEQEILLTAEGYLELETELNDLKINKRPEVIKALKEARALGDLSENADYDAARDAQAKLEGRIKELEYKLENAKIISNDSKDTVSIGSTVTISYIDDDETEEYKIVGSLEADPFNNKISNESPIGAAIIGKKVNEIVSVETPNGSFDVKIESIA
ncbi:MAG TPA: transcription elongation factor GreA [Bacilli bacterium]|jgi:transcription elongation factor greA|nr:transcription elongation factor GreA [Bacilli bacterium]